jgi:hypothetical protein
MLKKWDTCKAAFKRFSKEYVIKDDLDYFADPDPNYYGSRSDLAEKFRIRIHNTAKYASSNKQQSWVRSQHSPTQWNLRGGI